MFNELFILVELEEKVFELIEFSYKIDMDYNNRNFWQGCYFYKMWIYLMDLNNWFLYDISMMKLNLKWFECVLVEFVMVEDIDMLVVKWCGYMWYFCGYCEW